MDLPGGVVDGSPVRPHVGADGPSSGASSEPAAPVEHAWHEPVHVPPFTRQIEDGEVVIGHPERAVFLALPEEAMEILDLLGEGRTVAQARDAYQQRHDEVPDIQDLLSALAQQGFVAACRTEVPEVAGEAPSVVRFHFASLPENWARLVVHPVTGGAILTLVGSALAVAFRHPDLVPGWQALVFPQSIGPMVLLLMVSALLTTFFHEMAHLTVARARGISSRLGIGNRLWVLVAETDLSGLWAVPRRQRFLPLLAGMILDTTSAALLILVFQAAAIGLLSLPGGCSPSSGPCG
jgi:putative peptide zinc metalloprotease protein